VPEQASGTLNDFDWIRSFVRLLKRKHAGASVVVRV